MSRKKDNVSVVVLERYWDSDTLGVTFDVNKALAFVHDGNHETHALPTTFGPSYPDLDEKTVQAANTMTPGIVITYYNDSDPCWELIDGNHRFEKARRRGYTYYGVYFLSPDEARACEINIPDNVKERHYRNYWDP